MSELFHVVGSSTLQVAAALVFALLLRYFAKRDDRSYLHSWSGSWLAFAGYISISTASRLAVTSPPTSALRVSLSILSLTCGMLQVGLVALGTYELARRRRVTRPLLVPIVVASVGLAAVLTLAWINDPAAANLRYFARVGVRAVLLAAVLMMAGAWFAWRTRNEGNVGSRIFALAMLMYGADQLFAVYAAAGRPGHRHA